MSILWFFVIFQIVPQLLCEETTVLPGLSGLPGPGDNSGNITAEDPATVVKSSEAPVPQPSNSASSSVAPPAVEPEKPTRAPTVVASSPSTQPPLIHNKSSEMSAQDASSTTSKPMDHTTKKNSANSFYNHGIMLTSFSILSSLICAIF